MTLHSDFAGPSLDKMFFIIYDLFLKWINAIPMKNIKATSVISCLRNVFSTHGIPYFLVSDNEPSFSSQEFNEFCKVNRIKHLKIAPYHPSSNGAAECSVQIFKTALKKIIDGKVVSDLDSTLSHFMVSYCTTPHSTTGVSQAELLFNRKINTYLNFVKPKLSSIINEQEQKFTDFNNCSKTLRLFYLGDHVWVTDYGKILSKWVEGKKIEKMRNVIYKIQLKCNTVVVKHIEQIYLCYKPNIDELNYTKFPIPKLQNNENVSNNPNEIQPIIPSTASLPLPRDHNSDSELSQSELQLSPTETYQIADQKTDYAVHPTINEQPK